jgi:hypothetical protein
MVYRNKRYTIYGDGNGFLAWLFRVFRAGK